MQHHVLRIGPFFDLRIFHIKMIGYFMVLLSLVGMGCAPTLYINETYRKAYEVPVVDGNIALDNGIQIEVRAILEQEKLKPEKLWITRLVGSYVLVAEGFRYVWILRPAGETKASYTPTEIVTTGGLRGVKLLHNSAYRCVTLTTGEGAGQTWFIHASGRAADKCSDKAND